MNLILYGLLPLALYVIVDYFAKDMKRAIGVAIVFGLLELAYMYQSTGQFDAPSLMACAVLLLCGLVSLRTNNRTYFKLQPAIVSLVTAGFVAYLQYFSEPWLDRYATVIEQASPPEFREAFKSGPLRERLNELMNMLPVVITIHALWIFYAATYCRQSIWLAVNAFGFFILLTPLALLYLLLP